MSKKGWNSVTTSTILLLPLLLFHRSDRSSPLIPFYTLFCPYCSSSTKNLQSHSIPRNVYVVGFTMATCAQTQFHYEYKQHPSQRWWWFDREITYRKLPWTRISVPPNPKAEDTIQYVLSSPDNLANSIAAVVVFVGEGNMVCGHPAISLLSQAVSQGLSLGLTCPATNPIPGCPS